MTASSPILPKTSVLLFDFGGTLDADGIPWKDRFFRLARSEGLAISQGDFDRAFYAATDSLEGALPVDAGFRDTVQGVTDGLVARLGREEAVVRKAGERFADEALGHLAASAGLLARLSVRHRLGIVSNFYGNLEAVCADTGLTPSIRVAVDSTRVGCKKPDPRIFQAALDALGVAPAEAVFVGDSLHRDMAGAREMGMRHVWLSPEDAARDGSACCPGDPVISRLVELLGLDL